MRLIRVASIVGGLLLVVACGQMDVGVDAIVVAPTRTSSPATSTSLPPGTSTPAVVAPSFDARTYRDEAVGFELDYPASWDAPELVEKQSRGNIVQARMNGQVTLDIITLLWDPKNDLAAYVDVREQAFEGSGFKILEKRELALADSLQGISYTIETLEGEQAYFFFTAIGDRYLQLSGSGDLDLLAEIASTVRLAQ